MVRPSTGTIYWGRSFLPFDGSVDPIADAGIHVSAGAAQVDDVGPVTELRARHLGANEIGGRHRVLMPGLIDAHQHGRAITPADQGCWDETLELWLLEQRGLDRPDPALSARVAAIRSLLGGVTTVVHPHVTVASDQRLAEAERVVASYQTSGIRVTYGLDVRDRASYTYDDDSAFLSALPPGLRAEVERLLPGTQTVETEALEHELTALQQRVEGSLVEIALAPRGPQWCSAGLLEWVADASRRGTSVQIHCAETLAQYAWFAERNDTPVQFLHRHGLLSSATTLAHCVWLDETDLRLVSESGARVAHNPTSNLRLQSGHAPIGALLSSGVPVGTGTDSVGFGQLPDLFGEIRLGRWLENLDQRRTGRTPATALHDALRFGAAAANQRCELGRLATGAEADLILLDWSKLVSGGAGDHLTEEAATLVAEHATRSHVTDVVVGGRHVVSGGRYLPADQDELERAFTEHVARLKPRNAHGRTVAALRPYVAREIERLHATAADLRFIR